jgi:hypothetical protein
MVIYEYGAVIIGRGNRKKRKDKSQLKDHFVPKILTRNHARSSPE